MDIVQMLYLPVKPGPDLSNYFACLETASKVKFGAYNRSNWQSVVALSDDASVDKIEKYGYCQDPGFCDMVIYDGQSPTLINDIFPNVAALAGCGKSKNKKVPRGWITYHDKTIRVCTKRASKHISNAPKYTAWDGCEQFKPADEDAILFQVNIEIKSVHQLLCVVEGLLQTL